MHRLAHALGVLALLGTTAITQAAVTAPSASAAGGASNCSSAMLLCTTIQYSGSYQQDPRDPGDYGGDSGGYIAPCWLQQMTAWRDPNQVASTPQDMAQYFTDMAGTWHHNPDFDLWFNRMQAIYSTGHTPADPGIGLVTTPYNEGTSGGAWYTIACDTATYTYSDYVAIQKAMGVSDANLELEGWFWIRNPDALPVPTVTPKLLADYAANHVLITPRFPELSPAVGTTQTVGLPVESVNAPGENGYHGYSTTASLAGIRSTVESHPVTVTYTANPPDLISPESVTCHFDPDGGIAKGCGTFEFTRPAALAAGATLTATTTWNVTWAGNAGWGEPGWFRRLPGPNPVFTQVIQVQAIQVINVGTQAPTP